MEPEWYQSHSNLSHLLSLYQSTIQMPTLQRIKLLATNCATAPTTIATHSPTASPVVRIRRRRRKTLRMLFDSRHQDPPEIADAAVRVRRHKLKDLLLSSSPPPSTPPVGDDKRRRQDERQEQEGLLPAGPSLGGRGFRFRTGSAFRRGGAASLGPVSSAFRQRLLRRAWRPVLLTIPE